MLRVFSPIFPNFLKQAQLMFKFQFSKKFSDEIMEKKNKRFSVLKGEVSLGENKNVMDDVITKTQVVLNFL